MNQLKGTLVRWFSHHRVLTADQFEAVLFLSRTGPGSVPESIPAAPRRRRPTSGWKKWTAADDEQLVKMVKAGKERRLIARRLHRSTRAIYTRRVQLRGKLAAR